MDRGSIRRSSLAAGVLKVPDGRRQVFAPDTIARVSLASLAPQITFTLDEAEIRLIVSADPALLRATEVAISNPRPPGWKVSSNKAFFLNYSSNWSTDDTDHRLRRARRASLRRAVRERRQHRRQPARSRPD